MKKLCVIVVLLLASLTGIAHADQASHRKAIVQLLEITNARQMVDQMTEQINGIVDKQVDAMEFDSEGLMAAQKVKQEMAAWLSELLAWDSMKEMYVDVYMDVFSEAEIKEMIAFYQSPLGRKMLEKMPLLIQTTFDKTQAMMQKKMPEIQKRLERLEADLQSKYRKESPAGKP